ncbi:Guanine phosphoribosyltransferase [Spironucleus salmonicida]|uniref:Guanine phosphoribosyltransferase n=2 Tax=Spironucleus salmonicida TaxID=348837 RepID=V6LTK5_9EUKA|nr:Guanine phosphoribosyltransferase [Spironucleus salmonicida]KAH0575358.1 Guanine phosphoribosyltransferase [Spironucleus salmonicida]KAH0575360.1 Guanine phosphoribosyltransferase [Spironucleus salmonicida]|eukprot:EST47977.1 Guanine phosphoribosyltransferase [Spironucleus salmonicida]
MSTCKVTNRPISEITAGIRAQYNLKSNAHLLLTIEEVQFIVEKLARNIENHYKDIVTESNPLYIVGLLTGAYHIVSDITRRLSIPVRVSFIKVSSYQGTEQQDAKITGVTDEIRSAENVLIVDELWDTGNSVLAVQKLLKGGEICVAFAKDMGAVGTVKFLGNASLPDIWLLGYGLDCNGYGRNWPCVVYLNDQELAAVAQFRRELAIE